MTYIDLNEKPLSEAIKDELEYIITELNMGMQLTHSLRLKKAYVEVVKRLKYIQTLVEDLV